MKPQQTRRRFIEVIASWFGCARMVANVDESKPHIPRYGESYCCPDAIATYTKLFRVGAISANEWRVLNGRSMSDAR